MTTEVQTILDRVLMLPDDDRAWIAERLFDSLDRSEEIDREWLEVARQRLAALRSGEVRGIPVEKVIDAAKRRSAS